MNGYWVVLNTLGKKISLSLDLLGTTRKIRRKLSSCGISFFASIAEVEEPFLYRKNNKLNCKYSNTDDNEQVIAEVSIASNERQRCELVWKNASRLFKSPLHEIKKFSKKGPKWKRTRWSRNKRGAFCNAEIHISIRCMGASSIQNWLCMVSFNIVRSKTMGETEDHEKGGWRGNREFSPSPWVVGKKSGVIHEIFN